MTSNSRTMPTVFISSTCYDLLDARSELREFLEHNDFIVRVSDGSSSDFAVDAAVDSIESCLQNVAGSNVVICLVDQRYGGVLKDGTYEGKSATHAEILCAREKEVPVFFFIRDRAATEFSMMRRNGVGAQTEWVEKEREESRQKWFDMVTEISALPKHDHWNNWFDPFQSVVDLKRIVLKRLTDQFPQARIGAAANPERLVRLTFEFKDGAGPTSVYGHWHNVGPGAALNIEWGWSLEPTGSISSPRLKGAVSEGDRILDNGKNDCAVTIGRESSAFITCRYFNRFGDRYCVAFPVKHERNKYWPDGHERVFVVADVTKEDDPESWSELT